MSEAGATGTRALPRLTGLARLGFADLGVAGERLGELAERTGVPLPTLLERFERRVADPDEALQHLLRLAQKAASDAAAALADPVIGERLVAETLGEQVFQYVLKNKRREWNAYRSQVTPYELSTNLELL